MQIQSDAEVDKKILSWRRILMPTLAFGEFASWRISRSVTMLFSEKKKTPESFQRVHYLHNIQYWSGV